MEFKEMNPPDIMPQVCAYSLLWFSFAVCKDFSRYWKVSIFVANAG